MTTTTINGNDLDSLDFSIDLAAPDPQALAEGFNEYGVKDTDDRVEFVFEAMQPGIRKGVNITEDFLQKVAENFTHEQPAQVDHDRSMLANAGRVTKLWFSDGALRLRGYVPKTGASTHEEFVKRFTFDPPQVQNGSVGFGNQYEMSQDDDGNPMLVDGTMQEFSFLPFPGGYDEASGGLKAQFAEAYEEYTEAEATPDDDTPQGDVSGVESADFCLDAETIYESDTMTFDNIDFDETPEDLPEDLAEFMEQVEEAHKNNIEFIESVIEARDEAESDVEEYEAEMVEYKATLAGELAERDTVPLSADELQQFGLARLHEMDTDTVPSVDTEVEADADGDGGGDGESSFGKREQQAKNFTGDGVDDRAKAGLDTMPGIVMD